MKIFKIILILLLLLGILGAYLFYSGRFIGALQECSYVFAVDPTPENAGWIQNKCIVKELFRDNN